MKVANCEDTRGDYSALASLEYWSLGERKESFLGKLKRRRSIVKRFQSGGVCRRWTSRVQLNHWLALVSSNEMIAQALKRQTEACAPSRLPSRNRRM